MNILFINIFNLKEIIIMAIFFQPSEDDVKLLKEKSGISFPPSLEDFEILTERYNMVKENIDNLDTMDFSSEIKGSFRMIFDLISKDYKEIERRVSKNEDCIVLKFGDVYKRLDELIQLMLSSKQLLKK